MDAIFKALSDETRRTILDLLRQRDGLTLTELEQQLGKQAGDRTPMTRFGVMKHLKVLEAASLVVTRRSGRFKHHHLNAVPLQEAIDRWIEPLVQKPMSRALLDLKAELEGSPVMSEHDKPDFILETYIRTTPETLWNALTNGAITPNYFIADAAFEGEIKVGASYRYMSQSGNEMLTGEILEATPHKRLAMTFNPVWMDKDKAPAAPSRNVYEIEQTGDSCKLTIMHFGITEATQGVKDGWSKIAARLKTYLETGEILQLDAA